MKTKDKKKYSWLSLREDDIDKNCPFEFTKKEFKSDGLIFIFVSFLIPFTFSLLLKLFFNYKTYNSDGSSSWQYTANNVVYFCSSIVAMAVLFIRNKFDIKQQLVFFFVFAPIVFALLFSIIFANIMKSNKSLEEMISIIAQIFAEVLIIFLFLKIKGERTKIGQTFRKKYKSLFIVVIVGIILLFIFSVLFASYLIEGKLIKARESDNQTVLNSLIFNNNKALAIVGKILLVILTVMVAPLCEEITMRFSVYYNVGNKLAAFFISALYFGFVHYGLTCDFEHMLSYTLAGFVLSGIFLYSNGNITYSWLTHVLYNSISLVLVLT